MRGPHADNAQTPFRITRRSWRRSLTSGVQPEVRVDNLMVLPCVADRLVGFCTTYFLVPWVKTDGAGEAYGIMAMVLGVAFLVGIVTTQYFGRRWRAKYPPPKAEN